MLEPEPPDALPHTFVAWMLIPETVLPLIGHVFGAG